ncbi:MAG TPA: ROK family protein [Candidatus Dormibacteraeota bacterium]|jgi:glucokinase|nr:ROK family protein [Candidatus Dormibacteraeota bacterium]
MLGAIDIGGTKLLAAVAADGGEPGAAVRRPTPAVRPLETLVEMLDEARGGEPLSGLALAVPGPFDRARGALVNPPNMPPSWHGLALAERLGARYGCPVLVENDANCAALAESRAGAAAGSRSCVYFTVSTGIGSGVVVDGRPVAGRHDTEGGHQVLWPRWLGGPPCHCGGHGCLETLASGLAIARRFGSPAEELDDPEAWEDVGRWLGLGVVNAIALHDPEVVVLGGGVCRRWERFWPSLSATVDAALFLQPRPPVLRATLGEDRNLWGALALLTPG